MFLWTHSYKEDFGRQAGRVFFIKLLKEQLVATFKNSGWYCPVLGRLLSIGGFFSPLVCSISGWGGPVWLSKLSQLAVFTLTQGFGFFSRTSAPKGSLNR